MSRRKDGHRLLSCRLDGDLFARLDAYCEQRRITRTQAAEEAITAFLDAQETAELLSLASQYERAYGRERLLDVLTVHAVPLT